MQSHGHASRAALRPILHQVAAAAGREDPDPETWQLFVPGEVVSGGGRQALNGAFGKSHRPSPWHASGAVYGSATEAVGSKSPDILAYSLRRRVSNWCRIIKALSHK